MRIRFTGVAARTGWAGSDGSGIAPMQTPAPKPAIATGRPQSLKVLAATGLDTGLLQAPTSQGAPWALQVNGPQPAQRLLLLNRQRPPSGADRRFVALCGQVRETSR